MACNKFKQQNFYKRHVYKLLNKNLNFVPTQKAFDKKTFDKEINDFYDFYRCIKLKARFKDAANHSISLKKEYLKNHPVSPESLQKTPYGRNVYKRYK